MPFGMMDLMGLKCECGECNVCKSRERMRREREENPERVRARDRARYQRDKEKRRAAMDAYQATPAGREAHNVASRRWAKANYPKRRAHIIVSNALRSGKLVQGPCEVCGAAKVHAHHDDYTKPLEVRWLCPEHHAQHHMGGVI